MQFDLLNISLFFEISNEYNIKTQFYTFSSGCISFHLLWSGADNIYFALCRIFTVIIQTVLLLT